MKATGVVYLIHFNRAYKHARHYLGYSEHLDKRITDHLCGMGARLMEVVTNAGIEWKVSRTWPGDRKLERRLKNRKNTPLLCPVCNTKALNRATSHDCPCDCHYADSGHLICSACLDNHRPGDEAEDDE